MTAAGPELRSRLKRTSFSTLRNTGNIRAVRAPIGKRIGHGLTRMADFGEKHLTSLAGKGLRFALKRPLVTAAGLYVGHKIHQGVKAELAQMRSEGLELGFISHVVRTIAKHAPRIGKTTYGAAANRLRKAAPVAKSFFNKSTAMGRAALKVARTGGASLNTPLQSGRLSGRSIVNTAFRNKGKIAVGLGAGAAIHGATSIADTEPKAPTVAPIRMKIRTPSRL